MERENLLQMFLKFLDWLFGSQLDQKTYVEISKIPKKGDKGPHVGALQKALNEYLVKRDPAIAPEKTLVEDGDFGTKTEWWVSQVQKDNGLAGSGVIGEKTLEILGLKLKGQPNSESVTVTGTPDWQKEMLKHEGKHESDPKFQEYMNTYWTKSGLPNFKGLVGSARAWCGVFAFMSLIVAGYKAPINSFRAKAWDGWGHSISWKTDGIPKGAYIRTNSSGNCDAATGNHITTARGDCTAQDLNKANATIAAFGGNQGNMAKVSVYKVSTICYVGWPKERTVNGKTILVEKPAKVSVSINCTASGPTNESTQ